MKSSCCFINSSAAYGISRAGVVTMVLRFLGVPALAGEAIFSSGDFASVVLTAAVHTLLCKGTSADIKLSYIM